MRSEMRFPAIYPRLFSIPACLYCVILQYVLSLTFLRCVGGRVFGQGSKYLPFVLPAQPGPQEQDRIQLSTRYDVCRYGAEKVKCLLSTLCSQILYMFKDKESLKFLRLVPND